MDYFEDVAKDFLKGVEVYHEDTKDPETFNIDLLTLTKRMKVHKIASNYIMQLTHAMETDNHNLTEGIFATVRTQWNRSFPKR